MPSERSNRDALGPGPPPPGVAERRATVGEACTSAPRDARGHGVAPHQYEGSQRWHGSTPRGLLSRCLEDGGGFWMAGNSGMSPIASMGALEQARLLKNTTNTSRHLHRRSVNHPVSLSTARCSIGMRLAVQPDSSESHTLLFPCS
ncbi:unnamed protein product [Diplocarpon coronariae]